MAEKSGLLKSAVELLQQKEKELAELKLVRKEPRDSYDYLVVGAGASGCAVAARLSEDPNATVALLEAGCDDREFLDIFCPGKCGDTLQLSEVDWEYRTVPQKKTGACLGLKDGISFWPRGKTLGGSTSINYMQYIRGCKGDYDTWAQKYGCEGWSGDECWPYFIKSEGNLVKNLDPAHHNAYGDWKVTERSETHPLTTAWIQAGEKCGHTVNYDPNGDTQIGVQKCNWTIDGNGRRCSAAEGFLRRAESRPNFDVITRAFAKKVLLSSTNNAEAVLCDITLPNGAVKETTVRANKEIILSGGSIGSAHILMLSGIGPEEDLQQHGIECKANLPVGKNLSDHLMSKLELNTSVKTTNAGDTDDPASMVDYLVNGKGILTETGVEPSAFFQTGVRPDLEEFGKPDIQIMGVPCSLRRDADDFLEHFNVDPAVDVPQEKHDSDYQIVFMTALLHPESIGSIKLKSADPYEHPEIDPHYFENARDIKSMVAGMKKVIEICNTEPLKKHILSPRPEPKCPYEFGTDEYCEWIARHYTFTVYHPVGTCKVGAVDDPTAVVTPDLKVKGIKSLRVADCSIMPTLSSGNTMAPAVMIGERAADFIKGKPPLKSRL